MLERLTVYIDGEAREDHSRDTGRWKNGSRACMERLAAYEDTGLTPEEIAALRAELDALKADIEAGRLVRYPDFPQDMNDILEPLKVQSALNSEVMKLNFRKEHRPKDVSILDYTVIAALNKVLEEAAKTAPEGE